jgi:SAM-dependent methyltransferase
MDNNLNSGFLKNAVDELERMALEEAIKRRCFDLQTTALVLPGRCHLTLELARKGVKVDAGDLDGDRDDDAMQRALAEMPGQKVHFFPVTLAETEGKFASEPYDIIVCRQGLCALPYTLAKNAVRRLIRRLKIGGRLYLSVLGLHSELGYRYADTEALIGDRHCELSPEIADKYGIAGPVCLYTERDLFSLVLETGGSVLRTFTTTHGNVKGVAVRV